MKDRYPSFFADLKMPVAPWWEMWLARLFGRRIGGTDGTFCIVAYAWRGHKYIWSVRDSAALSTEKP
jgi:hypothetical protein